MENTTFCKRFVPERAGGEFKRSLVIIQLSFAILIAVFWGLLGIDYHYIAVVAAMVWGFGDAAAALVGKAFGRRRILHRWIEGAKTVEGTLAMYVVAGLAICLTLLIYAGQPWHRLYAIKLQGSLGVSVNQPHMVVILQTDDSLPDRGRSVGKDAGG